MKKGTKHNDRVQMVLWIAGLLAFAGLCMSAIEHRMVAELQALSISIDGTDEQLSTLDRGYVHALIEDYYTDPLIGRKIDEVYPDLLEEMLEADRYIETADASIDAQGAVHIRISERKPILRIVGDEKNVYIDQRGVEIPVHPRYQHRVPVLTSATGRLSEDEYDAATMLAREMNTSELLRSLIEQIHIDEIGIWHIVPKMGTEDIILGEPTDIKNKLYRLKEYYQRGTRYIGWDRYSSLNLSYKDQVVCRKKESKE